MFLYVSLYVFLCVFLCVFQCGSEWSVRERRQFIVPGVAQNELHETFRGRSVLPVGPHGQIHFSFQSHFRQADDFDARIPDFVGHGHKGPSQAPGHQPFYMNCGRVADDGRMGADIVLAEPTDLIGTGQVADDSYTTETVKALHEIDPNVLVMIASGVSTADDCYNVIRLGADGTGATSGILNAPSPAQRVREMAEAIVKAGKERNLI